MRRNSSGANVILGHIHWQSKTNIYIYIYNNALANSLAFFSSFLLWSEHMRCEEVRIYRDGHGATDRSQVRWINRSQRISASWWTTWLPRTLDVGSPGHDGFILFQSITRVEYKRRHTEILGKKQTPGKSMRYWQMLDVFLWYCVLSWVALSVHHDSDSNGQTSVLLGNNTSTYIIHMGSQKHQKKTC